MKAEHWVRAGGLVAMALTGLVGCGGGGGGGDSLTGPDYVTWNGSTNGDVVVDANNEEFRVDAETRQVEEIRRTLAVGDLDESWWDASRDLRLAAIAGTFADRLRTDGSSDLGPSRFWELLRKEVAAIRPAERGRTDQALLDLREMMDRAARLERGESEE